MIRRAMILAAGFGTRLRPLTNSMAKPMVPVCNRPMIGWAIDSLLEAGVETIVVNLHHAPRSLEEWVPAYVGDRATVHFSHEDEILGTGGGIRHARELLEGDGAFAVVNGDTIQKPPIRELARRREQDDALAALLLRVPPGNDRFTPVFFDGSAVTGFGEGTGDALMFSGCHVLSDRVFGLLPDRPFSGIVEHVYMPALANGNERLAGVIADDPMWFDVGTPRRFLDASLDLLRLITGGTVPVPTGSEITGSSLVASHTPDAADSSVVGLRCDIHEAATLTRSVLLEGVVVDGGSQISGSIIGPGVIIPSDVNVENAFVCLNDGSDEGEEALDGSARIRPVDEARPMRVG